MLRFIARRINEQAKLYQWPFLWAYFQPLMINSMQRDRIKTTPRVRIDSDGHLEAYDVYRVWHANVISNHTYVCLTSFDIDTGRIPRV